MNSRMSVSACVPGSALLVNSTCGDTGVAGGAAGGAGSVPISTGGGAYEVWAEPYASPPSVYFEGEQHPFTELDAIAARIMDEMHRGEIRCRWVEDD